MSNQAAGSTPGEGNAPAVTNFFDGMSEGGSDSSSSSNASQSSPAPSTAPAAPAVPTAPAQPAPVATPSPGAAPAVQPQPGEQPGVLPTSGALSLTPEQLSALVTGAVNAGKAPAEQGVKEPTAEEIDAKFGVVHPTEVEINTIFRGGAEGVKTLEGLLHRTAQQGALTASHHLIGEMEKLYEYVNKQFQGLSPIRQRAQEDDLKQHTDKFFGTYKHWQQEHVPVLKAVYDNLLAKKFNADGKLPPDQVYAKVNEEALRLMRIANPQFGAASGTGTPQNGAGTPQSGASLPSLPQSQMAQLPTGGSGGSGAAPGSSPGGLKGPAALFE